MCLIDANAYRYPRLYLGWNHKECVHVYCYFIAPPFHADLEIKWAINSLGPPFHGKRQPMSFDHILQLVDTERNSDAVKQAIAVGLSTQYHAQERFKEDTPIYRRIEPTSVEILIAWEDHSLNIAEDDNVQMVKDAVMSAFGFSIRKDNVELLKHFSILNKVSIFETNTWRQMMRFKCCPKKNVPGSLAAPMSRKENLRKRRIDDISKDSDEPVSKRFALPTSPDVTSSPDLPQPTTSSGGHASATSEQIDVAAAASSTDSEALTIANVNPSNNIPDYNKQAPSTGSSTNVVSKTGTNADQASNAPEQVEEALTTGSSTNTILATSINTVQAVNPSREVETAQRDLPPTPVIAVNSALSVTLTISTWLRVLPATTLYSGNISSTIKKWLKDTFDIDATSEDIAKITESATAENISPLQTTAFRCMAVAARKDLGNILMNPRGPVGVDTTRRASFPGSVWKY